jgi:hypothetical protein
MSVIAVSFTSSGSDVYNFVFDKFTEDSLPRSYAESENFSFSVNGAAILTGPARANRHIWAISSPIPVATAAEFDEMYQAWDLDRSNGLAVALGVIDQTFGDTLTTNAVFSTAPSYAKYGPAYMLVSFGLTEV